MMTREEMKDAIADYAQARPPSRASDGLSANLCVDINALYARLEAAEKCIVAVQAWRDTHACDEHASVTSWCSACCDAEVADEAVVDALNAWEATK